MFHTTVFCSLVKPIDRGIFSDLVSQHGSDHYGKSFRSWQHLVGMLYCQLSGARSLREAETMYERQSGVQYHLHLSSLKRSTLSQANNRRTPELFHDVASELIKVYRGHAEAGLLLGVIDSSPIQVKGRGNQWTKDTGCSRIKGLKLHLCMEPEAGGLDYMDVTHAKINDITAIASMPLQEGKTYVFDKAYCDYNWWHAIAGKGSQFVTRLKKNAAVKVVETHPIAPENEGFILKDETITLKNHRPRGGKVNKLAGVLLRRITVTRQKKEPLILVTNALENAPDIIAATYKKRWKIELLFKWIKRYLKVKTFLGETENSIKIHLYTAVIAYLLLWIWRKLNSQYHKESITKIRIIIQATLFKRPQTERCRNLQKILNKLNDKQLNLSL